MDVLAILKRDEGFRGRPYKCTAGKTTIGYGRNLDDNPLTEAEAEVLLRNDVEKCREFAAHYSWFAGLNEVRQAVVLSMIFQLGTYGFSKFVGTIKNIEAGDWFAAAAGMRASLWATQTSARAGRLARMMETGTWPSGTV